MELAALTWTDLASGASPDAAGRLLAVPVGSTEQHGPHLPLDTDTRLAVALAVALAGRRRHLVVAPALPFGSSGEHASFPGTLSIGAEALELVLVELVRSADAFAGVVLVNGHGGNARPLVAAADLSAAEGRAVLPWSWKAPAGADPSDAHAGRVETSLMLALDPGAVRLDRAEAGSTRPLAEVMDDLRSAGVGAVSTNGVLGDPAGASAEEGRRIFGALADDLCAAVAARFGP